MKIVSGKAVLRIVVAGFLASILTLTALSVWTAMPEHSFSGDLPPLTPHEAQLSEDMRSTVETLAGSIGDRNYIFYRQLCAAADFIESALNRTGLSVNRQPFIVDDKTFYNIEAEKEGVQSPQKILIIGAHYDSAVASPGANDNGSGIAALLALARAIALADPPVTVRFVAFANEESPFFWTKQMGSYRYAERCKDRAEAITAMLSLETIGYYADRTGSQHYMFPLGLFYPSRGNFIAFVSNLSSRSLLNTVIASFRRQVQFPSEGAALPWFVPGVFWSDHWPFWKMGYKALMITDTALFRYPYYHTPEDTPDKIDYDRMARVVAGLEKVIIDLAEKSIQPDF